MTALLEVRHLVKEFPRRGGLRGQRDVLRAVDDVSFEIAEGETFGLVGESGSGKTTIGRCILRLVEPTTGEIRFRGRDLRALSKRDLRAVRREMQIVFQDPYSSLNPRMQAGAIVQEPLDIHRVGTSAERRQRVRQLFALVGLDPLHAARYPHEFSGGQRQRIGLARALALSPSFLVADEPVSALDLSVQAQVINLLLDLQTKLGLTYLFISHDLRVVRHLCSRTGVLVRGRLVEMARTAQLFDSPSHPYTKALLAAVPAVDPDTKRERLAVPPVEFEPGLPLREVGEGHFAAI